uniref:PLAC8 like 1 n=2 Tax=Astyanax mexicanus TaxID=7994 RepID=A0A3B1KHD2_ASTMX
MQQLPLLSLEHSMEDSGERLPEGRGADGRRDRVELPVLTQPGLGETTTTVTTITQTGGDWSTGMFEVWSDSSTCLMGMFVPCCLDLSLAHQYGECLCLPLLPGSTFAMRVGIRERFKIRGNVCEDWAAVYFLLPFGSLSDDPGDEEEAEESGVHCFHRTGVFLRGKEKQKVCARGRDFYIEL